MAGGKGSSKTNGAILDDTAEVLLQRKQRFKAWADGHRDTKLKPNVVFDYSNSPKP